MKAEVYSICEALQEQMMDAAAQLQKQERDIDELKVKFMRQMQMSKGYIQSE